MVKSGGFIVGVASILGLPEKTVSGAFRVLRESGLMTSGARGVNAPDMTDLDASRMLIAMLVDERPPYAETSVRDFATLVCTDIHLAQPSEYLPEEERATFERATSNFTLRGRGLPEPHTLEQAVAELIRMYGDDCEKEYWRHSQIDMGERGLFDPHTEIEIIANTLSARISMNGNVYHYSDSLIAPDSWGDGETIEDIEADLDAEDAHELKRSRHAKAINTIRSVDSRQIAALARLLREARE
ncbi:hypothetical protein [Phyllobacterium salinisoli]|uniref:hypothetical protein n=1 Tax=Phyllobacterium salinisoli TaxID=1899321 RepID=UPI0011C02FA6|nr:hypothetical protein [Phyllobacterium salinisoli]